MKGEKKICVGQFAGAHGVRGLVRLRSFTEDPEAIFGYAPLLDETGKRAFKMTPKSTIRDMFLVNVDGVKDKEAADSLRGDKIYIPHELLPQTRKGEYYEADLIGLRAVDESGKEYGKVRGVFDHGGGPFLEIGASSKDSFMLPFRDAFVPKIDLEEGVLAITAPEGWISGRSIK